MQNHWIPFFNANTTVSHLGQAKPVGPRLEESRRIILESRLQSPIACPQSAPVFLVSAEIIHIQRTVNIRQSSFGNVLLNQATKSLEEFLRGIVHPSVGQRQRPLQGDLKENIVLVWGKVKQILEFDQQWLV